jgi:hypothetical protein
MKTRTVGEAMSEQDDKSAPDGWVAWHPEEGVNMGSLSNSEKGAWEKLDNVWFGNGWRIRPVKLLFLDEVEK